MYERPPALPAVSSADAKHSPSVNGPTQPPATRDRSLLLVSAFLRAVATGACGVALGLALSQRGLSARDIGLVVAAGLWGAALASGIVLLFAQRIARRRALIVLSALAAAGTWVAAHQSAPWIIAMAAFAGMVNGMGRDRGASLVIEQSALPGLVPETERTKTIAWYSALQDMGHAVGALVPAAMTQLPARVASGGNEATSALGASAVLLAVTTLLALALSPRVEGGTRSVALRHVSPQTRSILTRIGALFAVDAIAGGFLTTALLSYWFHERFGISAGSVGALFFAARVLNAVSHLGAAWLAKRIGLVNTMVFTHLPSSLLLVTVAFAPNFPVAAVLFLLREGLVEMDVPTRSSYVMAVVAPEERTVASAATHLVRMAGWAAAPAFAGALMAGAAPMLPLVIGAAMKIAYDLLLWRAFRHVRPPEERAA